MKHVGSVMSLYTDVRATRSTYLADRFASGVFRVEIHLYFDVNWCIPFTDRLIFFPHCFFVRCVFAEREKHEPLLFCHILVRPWRSWLRCLLLGVLALLEAMDSYLRQIRDSKKHKNRKIKSWHVNIQLLLSSAAKYSQRQADRLYLTLIYRQWNRNAHRWVFAY